MAYLRRCQSAWLLEGVQWMSSCSASSLRVPYCIQYDESADVVKVNIGQSSTWSSSISIFFIDSPRQPSFTRSTRSA